MGVLNGGELGCCGHEGVICGLGLGLEGIGLAGVTVRAMSMLLGSTGLRSGREGYRQVRKR
eukprot:1383627-Amorphochlora_amoeboformis.AAC.1